MKGVLEPINSVCNKSYQFDSPGGTGRILDKLFWAEKGCKIRQCYTELTAVFSLLLNSQKLQQIYLLFDILKLCTDCDVGFSCGQCSMRVKAIYLIKNR